VAQAVEPRLYKHKSSNPSPTKKKKLQNQALVADAYNPRFSGFSTQRSGGSWFEVGPGKQFVKPYLEKTFHKKRLVKWLKV
jgi:hypothetical protein